VLTENELEKQAVDGLQALIGEIPYGQVRLLRDEGAPDSQAWNSYLAAVPGMNWLQIPWFTAEAYFYRRILEATGYFEAGPGYMVDPYTRQKQAGMGSNPEGIETLSRLVDQNSQTGGWDPELFSTLLMADLWGNQADLSLWPAEKKNKPDHVNLEQAQAYLLVDDARACAGYLSGLERPVQRVDFLADNAGFELAMDMVLADYLLSCEVTQAARFHLKAHPVFVSDAMGKDMRLAIDYLADSSQAATSQLGKRLRKSLQCGRLQLNEHFFWTSPLAMWELPDELGGELASASLVISKGDANYRRLLGDRHWLYTTPLEQVFAYFKSPLLLLRTLKSEVAAGLPLGKSDETSRQDASWMTDGRWGLIQFWRENPTFS
jgi:uncharacterized protein with ATP-grasp and redox domains